MVVVPPTHTGVISRADHSKAYAEAANFALGITKGHAYAQLLESMESLSKDETNWVCNLANASSLLWHMYRAMGPPSSSVNWAGFYVRQDAKSLILGPFHGKVACQRIAIGRGVCGTAAREATTQVVPDVEVFPGHIACDGGTRSEIVVPIKLQEQVVGVIDIDCADLQGFDHEDQKGLEALADLLSNCCDWNDIMDRGGSLGQG